MVSDINIEDFKKGIDIVAVIGRDDSVKLRKKGRHYLGHCPFHNDENASMNVYPDGGYKCFACGAHGDVIAYVMNRKGLTFREAVESLGGDFSYDLVERHEEIAAPDYEVVLPIPKIFTPPSFMHYKYGMPKRVWEYRGKDGVYGYACRHEFVRDGRTKVEKDVLPYCVVKRGNASMWEYRGFKLDGGTPLYGLHKLQGDETRSKTVIVVEGEKTADSLQAVLPHVIVVGWMGGANRVDRADWSILKDWEGEVIGWPDNDWQGWAAMVHVSKMIGRDMRMILSPSDAPKGWDFADSDWDLADTRMWCMENMVRVHENKDGVYDFGDGGLVKNEWGWRLKVWEKQLN